VQLPGDYAAPGGVLLLALGKSRVLGCVALRPLASEPDCGEVRRLFVQPEARKSGVGRALLLHVIASARAANYRALKLETLHTMTAAHALYRELGFAACSCYRDNHDHDADLLCMRLKIL
jgi:putative acetyltransferase